jgi:glycosyltransferase involved in cell wall biosynthesis
VRSSRAHPGGFTETTTRHFPYDEIPLLRRFRPDVIISTELGLRTAQAILYRRLRRESRLVIWVDVSERTEKGLSRTRTALRRALLRNADAVIATGQSCRSYLLQLGVPTTCIVEVPFVGDAKGLRSLPLQRDPRSERRLLYVGQLIERKGLQQFVKELSRWATEHPQIDLDFWLVGDGPLRPALEGMRTPLNLTISFFGNVPYDSLPAYYAQAGIFVLPTLADTWALVVNEALTAGLPVLGSLYSQAVEQLVADGENGWTLVPDKPGDVRRALDRALFTHGRELGRMREAARDSVSASTPEFAASRIKGAIALALERPRTLESSATTTTAAERNR